MRYLLRTDGLSAPLQLPPPAGVACGEDADAPAVWFEDQRPVIGFEPWLEFRAVPTGDPAASYPDDVTC